MICFIKGLFFEYHLKIFLCRAWFYKNNTSLKALLENIMKIIIVWITRNCTTDIKMCGYLLSKNNFQKNVNFSKIVQRNAYSRRWKLTKKGCVGNQCDVKVQMFDFLSSRIMAHLIFKGIRTRAKFWDRKWLSST